MFSSSAAQLLCCTGFVKHSIYIQSYKGRFANAFTICSLVTDKLGWTKHLRKILFLL